MNNSLDVTEVSGTKTKQEEILEGIAFKLYQLDGGTKEYWDTSPKDRKEYLYRAKLMAEYLDSQGVVIKVKRELPDFYWETHKLNNGRTNTVSRSIPEEIQKVYAGFKAVESLIGE